MSARLYFGGLQPHGLITCIHGADNLPALAGQKAKISSQNKRQNKQESNTIPGRKRFITGGYPQPKVNESHNLGN